MGRRRQLAAFPSDDEEEQKPTTAASKPTRVYVGRVPSSLCLHEPGIRQLFEPFGAISTITVHHDALSMGADGFLFLEFLDHDAAQAAVAAVTEADEARDTSRLEGMCARLAVARGASAHCADPSVVDLLLGRRQASGFSQQRFGGSAFPMSQHDEQDEGELFLQSLSQRTTRRSSQHTDTATTGKKRKKQTSAARNYDDEDDEF